MKKHDTQKGFSKVQAIKMFNMHAACEITIARQAITYLAAMQWTFVVLGMASAWLRGWILKFRNPHVLVEVLVYS